MKKILTSLIFAFVLSTSAFASIVEYYASDFFWDFGSSSTPLTNSFSLQPAVSSAITIYGTRLIWGPPQTVYPDTNGHALFNLYPNSYRLLINGSTYGIIVSVPDNALTNELVNLISSGAGSYLYNNPNTNFYTAIDTNDLTPGLLAKKIIAGPGIGLAVTNAGGNESLVVSNAGVIQLVAGSGISFSPPSGQGIVTLNNTVSFSGTVISAACYSYTNITTNSVSWPTNAIPLINNGSTIYQGYISQYNFGGNSPCNIEAIVQVSAAQSLITHWLGGDLSGPGPDGVDGFAITTNVLSSTNYFVAILLHQDLHGDEHDYYLLNPTAIPTNATLCVLDDPGFGFSTNLVNTNLIKPFNMTTFLQGLIETNTVQ